MSGLTRKELGLHRSGVMRQFIPLLIPVPETLLKTSKTQNPQ